MAPPPQAQPGETKNSKASRPWFKKKRWWLVGAIVLFFMIGQLGNDEASTTAASDASAVEQTAPAEDNAAAEASAKAEEEAAAAQASAEAKAAEEAAAAEAKAAEEAAAAEAKAAEEAAAAKAAEEAAAKAAALEVVQVQAAQLLADFDSNEAAADAKYGGKILEVTGLVEEVDTEMFSDDKYVVRMNDGSEFSFLTVNCRGLAAADAAAVPAGAVLTMRGKFDDGGDLGVELNECSIL